MSREQRVELIQKIEKIRDSRIISMFMGDRQGHETRIAPDSIPLLARHLRRIGKRPRIDLVLYTLGGDVMSGYRIVHLFREYCTEEFTVIVPFRCQSTGTLISLGADRIIMLQESQLSPVDPSTNGPYNPMIPGLIAQPGVPLQTLPVSVEEVVSYISLAKEVGGLKGEESLAGAFEQLTKDVRPVALGQVFRARTQIRMLSRKLLQEHTKADDPAIDALVETLTEKLYSHDYLISRREAKAIGLKVAEPDKLLEDAISGLYDVCEKDLHLREMFNPLMELARATPRPGQPTEIQIKNQRAVIESSEAADVYTTEQLLRQHPQGVENIVQFEGWKAL